MNAVSFDPWGRIVAIALAVVLVALIATGCCGRSSFA
jgi:hypothetical protein